MAKMEDLVSQAETVFVSPVSVFEIGQKVRLGKWPQMEPFLMDIADTLIERGGQFAPLTPSVCLAASQLQWDHRDPFDRFLAATAIETGVPLVSADGQFDQLAGQKGWVSRIW